MDLWARAHGCPVGLSARVGLWGDHVTNYQRLTLVLMFLHAPNFCLAFFLFLCFNMSQTFVWLSFQDGTIDYGEFVAMMRKGDGGIGRRTMRMSMRDAPGPQ